MPTYLAIKKTNRRSGHRAKRSNLPARSAKGRFLKGHRSNRPKYSRPKARHNRPKSHRTARRSNRPKARRRSNLPSGFTFTKLGRHSGKPGGRFQSGWEGVSKWRGPGKKRANGKRRKNRGHRGKRRSNTGLIRYKTNTKIVHRTKRLRNPVGFDSSDSLKRLGTWGKIGLGIVFGLGGLVIAFGIPKGLAVVTGKDALQRGLGGVATAAVATLVVGISVGMLSKKAGLALIVAGGVGVVYLLANAISGKAAQTLIPAVEASLAAVLPTFGETAMEPRRSGPSDFYPGGRRAPDRNPGRGPSDFYPATPNTRSSTTGDEASFYGSALVQKERF